MFDTTEERDLEITNKLVKFVTDNNISVRDMMLIAFLCVDKAAQEKVIDPMTEWSVKTVLEMASKRCVVMAMKALEKARAESN